MTPYCYEDRMNGMNCFDFCVPSKEIDCCKATVNTYFLFIGKAIDFCILQYEIKLFHDFKKVYKTKKIDVFSFLYLQQIILGHS